MQRLILSLCFLVLASSSGAQDLAFGNPNQSLINLNPSFAGSNGLVRNQASFSRLSPNFARNYLWAANNFDMYVKPLSAGIGISTQWESYGDFLSRKSYGLVYAQHLKFSDGEIKVIPSIQALYKVSDYNPAFQQFSVRAPNYTDLNAGLLFTYKEKLYVGGSAFHLAEKANNHFSDGRDQRYFTFHSAYSIYFGEKHLLQFMAAHTRYYSHAFTKIMANTILYNHLLAGVGYGFSEAVFITGGYRSRNFSIAAGCNVSWSKLLNGMTSWEIHASFNIRDKEQRGGLTTFEKM